MKTLRLSLTIFVVSKLGLAAAALSGTVAISPQLSAKAKGIRTVFISLYDSTAETRMPCAAQKFEIAKDATGEFLSFSLDETSVTLMACPGIPEKINIKVKLDKDGSAGPDSPGDLVGKLNGLKKGTKGVKILVDHAS